MRKKKYQVFISSTFDDLHEARQAVTWALLKARYIPVGMEAFSATDDRGWKTISATIDDSDYYILLIAGALGSVDPVSDKSWTRLEYEYARSKSIPVLAFIRAKGAITQDKAEVDPDRSARLDDFRALVETNHHRERWTDIPDLVSRVSTALNNHVQDDEHDGTDRPGWFRGDQLPASPETLEELARLSRENAELRSQLKLLDEKRPSLEVWCEGGAIADSLVLNQKRVKFSSSDRYSPRILSAGVVDPDNVARAINTTVWLAFSLRNAGAVPARGIRLEIVVSPTTGLLVYPESMAIVPPNHWRTDPSGHVYIDDWGVDDMLAKVIERVRSINTSGEEKLVPFGIQIPEDSDPYDLTVRLHATDEGGMILDKSFTVTVKRTGEVDITDESRLNDFEPQLPSRE